MPSLNAQLPIFLAREQLLALVLGLAAADTDLRALLPQVQTRTVALEDVRAWFAERMPAD